MGWEDEISEILGDQTICDDEIAPAQDMPLEDFTPCVMKVDVDETLDDIKLVFSACNNGVECGRCVWDHTVEES